MPALDGFELCLMRVTGIATQSGGCIGVDSQPGRGTTFRIFLPRVGAGVSGAPSLSPR
jgi:nitrogen-specific signal transduction histidine kinase